jgi:short-subunit dehydrogenase
MIARKSGHIVSISSLQGIYAFPYSLTYCSTKFAVTGFMLGLMEFLRREKLDFIDVTCILPNIIATRDDIIKTVNAKKCVACVHEKVD